MESVGVKMAIHPDDPPLSNFRITKSCGSTEAEYNY
jgi:D-mannonate dehydratase